MTTTQSHTRPHQVTSATVEVGDVLVQGYGTSTWTYDRVADIEKRYLNQFGYTVAHVRFEDGNLHVMYGGSYYSQDRSALATDVAHAERVLF
jgi:hypothetical protein